MKASEEKTFPGQAAVPEGGQAPLPSWEQLPDIELYMDQVLSLMARYAGPVPGEGGKVLTASMVNNYVKTGLVPAPAKKRYTREHLAHLIIVCSLKPVLPLSSIRSIFDQELSDQTVEQFYAKFRDAAEAGRKEASRAFAAAESPALHAALRARAERDLAVASYDRETKSSR